MLKIVADSEGIALNNGLKPNLALEQFEMTILNESVKAETLLNQGNSLYLLKDFNGALKKYNDALYILKQNPKFDNAYGIEALNSLPPGKKPGTTDEDVDQWARGYYKQHGQYDNYDGLVLISRKLYPDWKAGKITDRKYDAVVKLIKKYTPEHLVGWKDPRYTNFNK